MPKTDNMTWIGIVEDGDLVATSLAGDREAFGQIVERYQRLLCSLAYSATGSVSESEDLAQEASLDLTEDAVKQRLSRGRKILQERVTSFVEGALSRSTPGRLFTVGVLAALPAMTPPAKAAGIGALAAQGTWVAKGYGLAALLASISGMVSAVLALRAHLDQTRTPRERRAVVRITVILFFAALTWLGALYLVRAGALRWPDLRVTFAWIAQGLTIGFAIVWPVAILRIMRGMRALRSEERRRHPELFADPRDQVGSPAGEYRSRWTLLGVPLIHLRFASPGEDEGPVFGWIAGGDRAFGLLFAWGGLSVAPVSVGSVAIGLVTVGTLGLGCFGLGTVGVGLIGIGCAAVGIKAGGWLSALGWESAQGSGFAVARHTAEAPLAFAAHANDAVARQLLADPNAEPTQALLFSAVAVLSLVPIAYYARAVRRRLGGRVG